MDRKFMEEYYDLKYQDTLLPVFMEEDEKCRKLQEEVMRLQGQVEEAMRGMGEESLQVHRKLFVLTGELEELMMRLAYLQGAKDREEMLR